MDMYLGGPKRSRFSTEEDFSEAAHAWWTEKSAALSEHLDFVVGIPDSSDDEISVEQWIARRDLLLDAREKFAAAGFSVIINEFFIDFDHCPSAIQGLVAERLGWSSWHATPREGGVIRMFDPPKGVSREDAMFHRALSSPASNSNQPNPLHTQKAIPQRGDIVKVQILGPAGVRAERWTVGKEVPLEIFEKAYDAISESLYVLSFYDKGKQRMLVATRERWLEARATFKKADPNGA